MHSLPRLSRRLFIAGASSLIASPARAAAPLADSTGRLQRDINLAAALGRAFTLPPAPAATRALTLPEGTHLIGEPGVSALHLIGPGPLLKAQGARRVTLSGVTLRGAPGEMARGEGLADFRGIADLTVDRCAFENAPSAALRLERVGGRVTQSDFRNAVDSAIFSLDATGLDITANRIEACGDNGIQVWRSAPGHDGARVTGNRIRGIAARSGGDGQYGNAISLFRAGGVIVSDNQIEHCAFSAVRNNSGVNVIIANNICRSLGETAIFTEFAFEGCVVQGNLIDRALSGIQIVNFADSGGQSAVCAGNVIRNLAASASRTGLGNGYQSAIKVEGDVAVTGNVIEGAPFAGILVGWGASLRDCAVSANIVRSAPIGIGVSVAPGAGAASILGNVISGAARAAIAGLAWDKIVSADLARDAPTRYAQIKVSGNQVS